MFVPEGEFVDDVTGVESEQSLQIVSVNVHSVRTIRSSTPSGNVKIPYNFLDI